jgi:CDP-6-deoxy-D-xylo-4-hexulose-3-dehydrase
MNYKELKINLKKYINLNIKKSKKNYSLLDEAFSSEDLIKGIEVLLSKKITMGEITHSFEKEFSKYMNVNYALMTNSGSSANLLAAFALINPKKKNFLRRGDEFIIQSLCWSTSLWPMIQAGLKPKFIDVNFDSFNIDYNELTKVASKKTKAIMLVHVLGNSTNMSLVSKYCKHNKIYLIEDTCESLGSKYKNKFLGTFGDFGTYSFYYSHQITSGEGGMIVCNSKEDYHIINSMRAHGWDRGIVKNKKKLHTFNFINSGFNLRPTDIAAAIGLNQFRRLNHFKKVRAQNKEKIIKSLINSKKWNNQFKFFKQVKNLEPSWFGFPLIINNTNLNRKNKFLSYLRENGIETRPIISGNFMNQKSIELYKLNEKKQKFKNAQKIEDTGFFMGLHTQPIEDKMLAKITYHLLNINNF